MRGSVFLFLVVLHAGPHGCSTAHTLEDAECPPEGTELRYQGFGEELLAEHCQTCHGREPGGRRGAPEHVTFATHDDVLEWADRIYARAAGENTTMPPGPDGPSAEERALLAEWLACGAPH